MRVLVTGSRDWPYPTVVYAELTKIAASLPEGEHLTIVHGACPTGADVQADEWTRMSGRPGGNTFSVSPELHPADWAKHGKAAGFIRNQEMVNLGADLCLAFCYLGSKGTRDCVNRADLAGIPIRQLDLDLIELKGRK